MELSSEKLGHSVVGRLSVGKDSLFLVLWAYRKAPHGTLPSTGDLQPEWKDPFMTSRKRNKEHYLASSLSTHHLDIGPHGCTVAQLHQIGSQLNLQYPS